MQELGNAINDSLSESDRIAEAIGEIKRAGYDVFLVLEATIGFNRRDENAEDEDENQPDVAEEPNACRISTYDRGVPGRMSFRHARSALSEEFAAIRKREPDLDAGASARHNEGCAGPDHHRRLLR